MADTTPPPPSAPRPQGGGGWLRPLILGLSCLIIGFVGGWFLRGDGGGATVLPPANDGNGTQTTGVQPAPVSTAGPPPAPPAPARADVRMVVLNATDVNGLAARTKAKAEGLGYVGVGVGNAPQDGKPTIAYYKTGSKAAAQRAARALAAAGPDVQVVVVLGTG